MSAPDLDTQARSFAAEVNTLLNGTVTHGVRLSAVISHYDKTVVHLAYGIRPADLRARTFPLAIDSRAPRAHLYVAYILILDDEAEYLTVQKSQYGLYLDGDREHMLVHWDYDRAPPNDYPDAHVQVNGEAPHFAALCESASRAHHGNDDPPTIKDLKDFHFPVGGRRFRPTLEDVVEFLIVEQLVDYRPNWKRFVETQRELWTERQLRAAVRRHPDFALEQLRQDGLI